MIEEEEARLVADVLARELRDLVSVHSEWLSQEVPGFAEALAWPETPLVTSPRGGGAAGAPGAKQRVGRRVAPPDAEAVR